MIAEAGGNGIEQAVGIYIGLLLVACLVGAVGKWVAHVPYTIALTLVGLAIGLLHIGPDIGETGFSKDLVFFVLLPPLLFNGALHLELNRLLAQFRPICIFAIFGVLISTFVAGGVFKWIVGVDAMLVGLLFGAMVAPTDPVSVVAIFKEVRVPGGLKYLVEGESLFNDGTGVVIFTIILDLIKDGGEFSAGHAALDFVKVAIGGAVLGVVLGGVAFAALRKLDDHLIENALCLVLAYGAFWVGEHVLELSGVIATVVAGLMIGNYGRRLSMSPKTTETVETFFESIEFLINSVLFILIGLELQSVSGHFLADHWRAICAGVAALLVSRAVAVYPLYWATNLTGTIRPKAWAHVLFWGGLRGSIPIALLLGLLRERVPAIDGYRDDLLVGCFTVVFFSLVVQGLTMKPLLRALKVGPAARGG